MRFSLLRKHDHGSLLKPAYCFALISISAIIYIGYLEPISAQESLITPPRIIEGMQEIITPTEPAKRSVLSIPEIDAHAEPMEEVLVVRENIWRLPDLSGDWRNQEDAQQDNGRIKVEALPLWDPESEKPFNDFFAINTQMQRVGYIELFRIRFGRR